MYTGLPKVCQKTKTTCFLRMISVSLENDRHLSSVFSVRSDKKGTMVRPPGLENINMNGPCVGFGPIPPTLATGVS